jgi:hypothetical protein
MVETAAGFSRKMVRDGRVGNRDGHRGGESWSRSRWRKLGNACRNCWMPSRGGEEVEIRAEDGRSYRLASSRPRPPVTGVPKAGRLKGRLVVPDDIKEPLEDLREYME